MALTHNLADIRNNYSKQALSEESVSGDPISQFDVWLEEAIAAKAEEPTAMVLSTVNAVGKPSARVVLLKDVSALGFTFFTNYDSRKGRELNEKPFAAITFFWPALERQVRIEGKVVKVAPEVSDKYFHSRPKGSQIGACASPQSQEVESRSVLEEADKKLSEKYATSELIPRPPHWGGYQLQPERIEFWQGRPNRLHDRIVYEQQEESWKIIRLAP
ncbi:pyridoxamine 5'-phosphate oxidase [Pontibacter diazotrophicus]|uniref:Pyridoxine/pyridoxamine 5'-phosphate oxidase n=1 Tax=Pontibacter diazotrophicus TaxID=1400979 RepID=A0A3D8LFS7_9BACT|nr:pyridoxamine 5'-phosphate oxidase [Pontibacter diazotrophicus]RDV16301.1 pyridoxamine 5'-phosphate oxidase [Pontibacter diazotrophicus]